MGGHDHRHHSHSANQSGHGHEHGHQHGHGHGHTHGVVDPVIATTARGIWALKWSFVGLAITAVLQLVIFIISGSIALLADTIHNVADAFTAIPLWIAFLFARRPPSKRFAYGLGRVEDLAGAAIVLVILISALIAGYESIDRLFNPVSINFIGAVAAAGVIGFIGNEAVAVFRIRIGREINSTALIADGLHARVDGFTSLGVLAGAVGVWIGFPLADPIAGLLVTAFILKIVWDSSKSVFTRMLDGVDPQVTDQITHQVGHVAGVEGVTDIRARWLGHRLEVEAHITVADGVSAADAHDIGIEVSHHLSHAFPYIGNSTIHVDPIAMAGIEFHRGYTHQHDDFPQHTH